MLDDTASAPIHIIINFSVVLIVLIHCSSSGPSIHHAGRPPPRAPGRRGNPWPWWISLIMLAPLGLLSYLEVLKASPSHPNREGQTHGMGPPFPPVPYYMVTM